MKKEKCYCSFETELTINRNSMARSTSSYVSYSQATLSKRVVADEFVVVHTVRHNCITSVEGISFCWCSNYWLRVNSKVINLLVTQTVGGCWVPLGIK